MNILRRIWTFPVSLFTAAAMMLAAVLVVPGVALASDGGGFGAVVSGVIAGIAGAITPEIVGGIVAGVLMVGGGLLHRFFSTAVRKRNVAIAIRHGYLAVEEIARLDTEGTIADKVAAGLREVDKWMVAQGWRPLSDDEKQVARLGFTAISGEQHAAAKVAARAALLEQHVTATARAKAAQLGGGAAVPSGPRAS